MKNFENFLKEKFAKLRPELLDDEISAKFEKWLDTIDLDLWIELGEEYGRLCLDGDNLD